MTTGVISGLTAGAVKVSSSVIKQIAKAKPVAQVISKVKDICKNFIDKADEIGTNYLAVESGSIGKSFSKANIKVSGEINNDIRDNFNKAMEQRYANPVKAQTNEVDRLAGINATKDGIEGVSKAADFVEITLKYKEGMPVYLRCLAPTINFFM